MEAFLGEKLAFKAVAGPIDFNAAAITGNRVSMKGAKRISFLVAMGTSTSVTAVTFTLRQHNAATAGTSKDLVVANPYFVKIGAATVFTKVTPASAVAATDLTASVADAVALVIFEVLAEDLDLENDFAWVSLDVAKSGTAKIGSVVAIASGVTNKPAYSNVI